MSVRKNAKKSTRLKMAASEAPLEQHQQDQEVKPKTKPDTTRSLRSELKTIKEKVSELESRNKELEEQLQAGHESLLHAKADFENFRRRNRKDSEEALKYAPISLLGLLLPVVDNFTRALDVQSKDYETLYEGINMVYRQFNDVLTQIGLERMEAVGAEFDPHQHHIVAQIESDAHDKGIVLQEFQAGYKYLDRIVRPAQVGVTS